LNFKSAEKEWGDGIMGLNYSSAVYALNTIGDKPIHAKNWRPQLLICAKYNVETTSNAQKMSPEDEIKNEMLFNFARQLKKTSRGLIVVTSVIKGEYLKDYKKIAEHKKFIQNDVQKYRLSSFVNVTVAPTVFHGLAYE
jgi:hypothetical protein